MFTWKFRRMGQSDCQDDGARKSNLKFVIIPICIYKFQSSFPMVVFTKTFMATVPLSLLCCYQQVTGPKADRNVNPTLYFCFSFHFLPQGQLGGAFGLSLTKGPPLFKNHLALFSACEIFTLNSKKERQVGLQHIWYLVCPFWNETADRFIVSIYIYKHFSWFKMFVTLLKYISY